MTWLLILFSFLWHQAIPFPGPGTPAIAPTGHSDTFAGTAGTALHTHDANWTSLNSSYTVANLQLDGSGHAQGSSVWATGGAYYAASSSDTSQIDAVAYSDANIYKYVCVRGDGTNAGYCLKLAGVSGGNWTVLNVWKWTGGLSVLATLSGSWPTASTHTLKIVASGTSSVVLTAYIDGTCVGTNCATSGSYTDSSSPLGAGHPGFAVYGNGAAATVANWQDH